jgi:hypothetical protein
MSTFKDESKHILELEFEHLLSINSRINQARIAAEGARIAAEGASAYLNSLIELRLATQEQIDRLQSKIANLNPNVKLIVSTASPTTPVPAETSAGTDKVLAGTDNSALKVQDAKESRSENEEKKENMVMKNLNIEEDSSLNICRFNDLCFYHPDNYKNKVLLLFTRENPDFDSNLFYMCKFKHTKPPKSICMNPGCYRDCGLVHVPSKNMWCKYATSCIYSPENIQKVNAVSFSPKHVCWKIHATKEFGFKKLCSHVFKSRCRNTACELFHSEHLD